MRRDPIPTALGQARRGEPCVRPGRTQGSPLRCRFGVCPRASGTSSRRAPGVGVAARLALVAALVWGGSTAAFAWGIAHDDASWLAAQISPEPFRSHPEQCLFALYPDNIQDHAVGHGRDGYLGRLFTLEAIAALREGDVTKGLCLASAATHYLTDRACIAHATRAWYHKPGDAWTKFLPKRYREVLVPHETKEIYYPHLKGTAKDTVLLLPEPEYCNDVWRKFGGSTNAYFDSLPSVRSLVSPDMLRRPAGWTFTDFDQYARWYALAISLDMLEPASLGDGNLRLRDPAGMRAVSVEELINGAAQDAAYYGYVATAARTVVDPSFGTLLDGHDKLLGIARSAPAVLIPQSAPWPVERAAHVVAMELLRAERRLAVAQGGTPPEGKAGSLVLRVPPGGEREALRAHSAVVLAPPEDQAWLKAVGAPALPDGKAGVLSAQAGESGRVHIFLRGATQQETLYLVDYLLDLAWAPVHGRWPAEKVVAVLQDVWAGWKLILDLRGMSGQAAADHARKCPYRHQETRDEDSRKYHEGLKQGVHPGASEEEWWSYFLLEIPLPDGRRGSDVVDQGADYTELLARLPK